ncbi:hypothetical protein COLO4_03522, partial [Corchorus olitorius]
TADRLGHRFDTIVSVFQVAAGVVHELQELTADLQVFLQFLRYFAAGGAFHAGVDLVDLALDAGLVLRHGFTVVGVTAQNFAEGAQGTLSVSQVVDHARGLGHEGAVTRTGRRDLVVVTAVQTSERCASEGGGVVFADLLGEGVSSSFTAFGQGFDLRLGTAVDARQDVSLDLGNCLGFGVLVVGLLDLLDSFVGFFLAFAFDRLQFRQQATGQLVEGFAISARLADGLQCFFSLLHGFFSGLLFLLGFTAAEEEVGDRFEHALDEVPEFAQAIPNRIEEAFGADNCVATRDTAVQPDAGVQVLLGTGQREAFITLDHVQGVGQTLQRGFQVVRVRQAVVVIHDDGVFHE